MHKTTTATKPSSWVGRVPQLKPGKYADGLPLHQIQYLCCKLVLKPNHFRSRKNLFDFGKVLVEPAKRNDVAFSVGAFKDEPIQIREVLFVDTSDLRLYNNAFILRRRIRYEDGFPTSDPEIVFKFRHPDIQKAAETDVRPAHPRRSSSQVQVSDRGSLSRSPPRGRRRVLSRDVCRAAPACGPAPCTCRPITPARLDG
jgi:hypothetical protein